MANLIPTTGKRQIVLEYWARVVVVWMFVLALAVGIVAVVMVPTYVLVNAQNRAFDDRLEEASSQGLYETTKSELHTAHDLAAYLLSHQSNGSFVEYVADIDTSAGEYVRVNGYQLATVEDKKSSHVVLSITGTARNREELATFKEAVTTLPWIESVELPLSSLAGGEDILFTMQATLIEK